MRPFMLIGILFVLTIAACTTAPKKKIPTCIEKVCFESDTNARIKNIVWGKDKIGVYIKDINWFPGEFKNGLLVQGHFEFQFVSARDLK